MQSLGVQSRKTSARQKYSQLKQDEVEMAVIAEEEYKVP